MIAFIAWLLEFCLEVSGACLAYRSRLTILTAYLAFSAAADVITYLILWRFGGNAYGVAEWITEAVQYLILCALACQIVARMLEDYRRLTGLACGLCALLGVIVGFIWNRGETWAGKFLDSEISASMFLAAMIVLGWIGKKKDLEGTWRIVAIGLLVMASGNALCAALSTTFTVVVAAYPIPQIASLLLWNLAALRNQRKENEWLSIATNGQKLDADLAQSNYQSLVAMNASQLAAYTMEDISYGGEKKPAVSVKSLDLGMKGQRWVN